MNPAAVKLTPGDVRRVYSTKGGPLNARGVAALFDVSWSTVYRIWRRGHKRYRRILTGALTMSNHVKPCDHPYSTLVVRGSTGEVFCTKCQQPVAGLNKAVKATLPREDGTPGDRPTLAPPTATPDGITPEV